MEPIKIIAVAGTNGSGKDTLGEVLADYDWLAVSVSDFLRDEVKKRGLPVERENLRMVSAEWRRQYGMGVLVDKAVERFKQTDRRYRGVVAIPMRNAGEAKHANDLGATLVWVDADPQLRYQRIYSRQRSPEDQKTFEQFQAEEQAEIHRTGDKATLSLAAVKDLADIFITNDSNNLQDFRQIVQKALKDLI